MSLSPPSVPQTLLALQLNNELNHITLDADPLHQFLCKLAEYVKDINARGIQLLRSELDTEVSAAKRELTVEMFEKRQEMESSFATKAAVEHIDMTVTHAQDRLQQVETKQTKLDQRLQAMALSAEGPGQDAPRAPQASRAGNAAAPLVAAIEGRAESPPSPATAPLVQSLAMPAASYSRSSSRRYSTRSTRNSSHFNSEGHPGDAASEGTRHSHRDLAGLATSEALRTTEEQVEKMQESLGSFQRLTHQMQSEVEKMQAQLSEHVDRADELLRGQAERLESGDARLRKLEDEVPCLESRLDACVEHAQRLEQEGAAKSTALQDLDDRVGHLRRLIDFSPASGDLEKRVGALEDGVKRLQGSAEERAEEVAAIQLNDVKLNLRLEQCSKGLADVTKRVDTGFHEQFNAIAEQGHAVTDKLANLDLDVSQLSKCVGGLAQKADQSDVAVLRSSLNVVLGEMKSKEQAVLFGARCLSCNREFDDVQQNAGIVSLHSDRQRARMLAEIQHALHSPKADPTESIKMIAVKVGRPGHLPGAGGLGPFEGRDVDGARCTIDDIHVLPARGRSASGGQDTTRPPTSQTARAAAAANFRGAFPRDGGSTPLSARPSTTPGNLAREGGGGASCLRSGPKEGPADYRHTLTKLVGRGSKGLHSVDGASIF